MSTPGGQLGVAAAGAAHVVRAGVGGQAHHGACEVDGAPAPVGAFERDRVHVAQLGGAYLIPSAHDWLGEDFYTDLKIYADVTYTRFADGTRPGWQRGDVVLLVGARFSFY